MGETTGVEADRVHPYPQSRPSHLQARKLAPVTAEREQLRRRFANGERWFHDSPLYQVLARAVSENDELLALAGHARAGQQPTNLMMGATHLIVLEAPEHPFARFFATVAGDLADPPQRAGAEYAAFCAEHRDAITTLLRTRLVQTNEPARATAVRLALHEVGRRLDGPAFLLEVGPSAGIQLCFDRWGVETGGRRFGPPDAPLTVTTEWRNPTPTAPPTAPPDLDDIADLSGRLGLDLNPVDATDPDQRRWLQALVWPEHVERFDLLQRALAAVALDPPEIVAGDAIDALAELDAERLPSDRPLIVFHSQVRIHVPAARRVAFDAAIDALAARRRLLHVALEHRDDGPAVLSLRDSEGEDVDLARAHGHGRWIAPSEAVGR